jgi:Nucleotidyl transferase AbiEii toxin, Type IV TA system
VAASKSGRPPHLLEKDVWVVWALAQLFGSPIGAHLSFKGGTSLSKAYKVIDRFSEDIDLTYDVRELIPELANPATGGMPPTRSQSKKWTESIRETLPKWITDTVFPILNNAIKAQGLTASLRSESKERLFVDYTPSQNKGYGYVKPSVLLDFGARSTGEPTERHKIVCDAATYIDQISFPVAQTRVMKLERTFCEKATAAHVYCIQGDLKGERYARHWYDLMALSRSNRFEGAINDRELAKAVATHKEFFFRERAPDGSKACQNIEDKINKRKRS